MVYKDILRQRAKKQTTTRALNTLSAYQILGAPVVTEKAFKQMEGMNTYVFTVHDTATKPDVIASLFYIYKVTPLSIRIVNVGKKMRMRRGLVRKSYKKVYVTLKKGDKIDLTA